MQDYLIIKSQIDPIENEVALEIYKANEWQNTYTNRPRHDSDAPVGVSVLHSAIL